MNKVTEYHSRMLNHEHFIGLHDAVTITTKTWIEIINLADALLKDLNYESSECERKYWKSLLDGVIPPNVKIIRPSPMTKIR